MPMIWRYNNNDTLYAFRYGLQSTGVQATNLLHNRNVLHYL